MDMLAGVAFLLLVLFLVGRRLPAGRWLPVLAVTLAVVVVVVLTERAGLWPTGWTTR